MSTWVKFVTQFYKDKKRSNPNYMFKHAMKDAAKAYKKQGHSRTKTASPRAAPCRRTRRRRR
jgi:hypothetical protein